MSVLVDCHDLIESGIDFFRAWAPKSVKLDIDPDGDGFRVRNLNPRPGSEAKKKILRARRKAKREAARPQAQG